MLTSMKYSCFTAIIMFAVVHCDVDSSHQVPFLPDEEEETTGNYIIGLNVETSHSTFEHIANEVRKQSTDHKIVVKVEGPFAKIITAKLTEDQAKRLMQHEDNIEFIEKENYASIDMSWAVDRIDQVSSVLDNRPYTPCECGNGVDVYVLDTGIRYDHCEFGGGAKYVFCNHYVFDGRAKYPGYDPIDNYNDTNLEGRDCHGHGTHIASLAVGNVSGLARCATVYSVRVLDCNGRGPYSVIIDGLNYAASKVRMTRRPSVILMSLGGSFSSSLNQVVTNVVNQGIPVVTSAGNDRGNACTKSPASNPGAITVGSTFIGDYINYNTNAGPCVDIFAPGAFVTAASHTCSTCSCTKVVSGTSVAAALVSGAVALLLEKDPLLSPACILDTLKINCLKFSINFLFLSSYYKSTTNNCFLHVKQCTDVCGITPTSTFVVTRTSTSIYVTTSINTTTCTKTTNFTECTTLTCPITLTTITTVSDSTMLTCHSTSTYHESVINNITSTHGKTETFLTTMVQTYTSTHHITSTDITTSIKLAYLTHTSTSTKFSFSSSTTCISTSTVTLRPTITSTNTVTSTVPVFYDTHSVYDCHDNTGPRIPEPGNPAV
ncbi:PREDICTED: uncharacterized protein LOC109590200 [Amphimedon queenslandica]|uniref:Peptidase S8/S53 domain-containing protein n=1 Tax=Amphimedon queenslandica TaxID=400682 RepID=A0AAN0JXN7_AMPQE|nr:PREDICTED: uncharacterized protein LOC109590200 [Amphimedon queenslandica]|eukprot:XP_019861679.1 PREDICTED: uncharacterized protein LOC109590200 [Amphimedon queenslandica]